MAQNASVDDLGGGDILNASLGDTLSIANANAQIDAIIANGLSGGAFGSITLAPGSSAQLSGADDSLNVGANATASVNAGGGNDTAALSAGSDLNITGALASGDSDPTINASGATITTPTDSGLFASGSNNTFNLGSSTYFDLGGGTGETINTSNSSVIAATGAGFDLASGTGNVVTATGSAISAGPDASFSLGQDGGNDTINLAAGSALTLTGALASGDDDPLIDATGATITTPSSTGLAALGDNDTYNLGSDTFFDLESGTGDNINASNSGIVAATGTGFNLASGTGNVVTATGSAISAGPDASFSLGQGGGNDTINLANGSALTLTGALASGDDDPLIDATGATITTPSSTGLAALGDNDTYNLGSDSYFDLESGTGDNINASNSGIVAATGTGFDISGSNNTANLGQDAVASISGAGNVIDLSSGSTATLTNSGSTGDIVSGLGGTAYLGSGGTTLTDDDSGLTVLDASGVTGGAVTFGVDNASLTSDIVGLTVADASGVTGGYVDVLAGSNADTIDMSGGTVATQGDGPSSLAVDGSNDTLDINNNASITFGATGQTNSGNILLDGSNNSIDGVNDTISALSNTGVNVSGGNDTLNIISGDTLNISNGSDYIINATGNINVNNDTSENQIYLSGNTVLHETGGGSLNVTGGNATILADSVDIWTSANSSADIAGSNDYVSIGNSSTVTINAGSYDVTSDAPQGDTNTLYVGSGADAEFNVNNTNYNQALTNVYVDGSSNTIDQSLSDRTNIDYKYYVGESLDNEFFNTTGGIIYENHDSSTVVGDDNFIDGGNNKVSISGSDDYVDLSDSTIQFTSNSENDSIDGGGDSEVGWNDNGDGNDDYTGYGNYGYASYGFAANRGPVGSNIGAIAAFDAANKDQADAVVAETARLQAEAAASATGATSDILYGAKWEPTNNTITWTLDVSTASGSPFSNVIASQYEAEVLQAVQTWAQASGLNFDEVSNPADAALKIGWSTLDPADTGVLGYTALRGQAGQITSGAILLEDPSEDPLATDANGQLAYSGTGTELEQLILHEIGHALGLADSTDPNSIMAPTLSSANLTLDNTDIDAIQALYGSSSTSATSTASDSTYWSNLSAESAQLIDAIAGFTSAGAPILSTLTTLPSTLTSQTLPVAVTH